MAIYLGLDSSTQSLTATAIEITSGRRSILLTRSFRYEDVLPEYGTHHGVLPHADPTLVHAPPLMWTEALERMFSDLTRHRNVDWNDLRAISGSAQQHGSVYLNALATQRLTRLDPELPLKLQLEDVFARPTSPVWMDSSTSSQCAAIETALGGPSAVARLTGSRAYERFTGPQIRKFAEQEPSAYALTDRVHLVSSWMASLLACRHAPIDHGDGSGMNLMDLTTMEWSPAALYATALHLESKLPRLAPSWTVAGSLAPFWTHKYDLPPARIIAWSGDNPCSLVGAGVVREGIVAVSLGTSDTVFGLMREPRVSVDGTGHVFASPTGDYMAMTVFKNGSLARERLRDAYGLDWNGFSHALGSTPAGNNGATMLPWFEPEITPLVLKAGVRRHLLNADAAAANIRALVEAQMMALRLHSRWMETEVSTIHATGGAASNRSILQVLADVFNATVFQLENANSAALGAALRAFHADQLAEVRPMPWTEVIDGFVQPVSGSEVRPHPASAAIYRDLLGVYAEREREALGMLNFEC